MSVKEVIDSIEALVKAYAGKLDEDEEGQVASELATVEAEIKRMLSAAYADGYDEGQFEHYADLRHDTEGEDVW